MTEVSAVRTPGRPRALGDVKDDASYLKVAHRSANGPRLASSRLNAGRVQSSDNRALRDVQDGLRQAALINIVASVNDGTGEDEIPPGLDSSRMTPSADVQQLGNTMTMLSNLVLSKDRTISIPKPQSFEDPPEKFSTKKPVFYKHSTDEVSKDESDTRKRNVSLATTRTNVTEEQRETKKNRTKSESIQISVSLQQLKDEFENVNDVSREWFASPAKVRIARSMTPRRRRVTSKPKKSESRVTTTISTCEAVDIMDTTESLNNRLKKPNISSAKDLGRQRVELLTEDLNLYRAKSLPALFPVKKKKEIAQPSITPVTEKSKLISPFKRPSVRAYGGMPHVVLGKTMQVKNEGSVEMAISNSKYQNQSASDKPFVIQDTEVHIGNKPPEVENETNIALEGRSIPNLNPRAMLMAAREKRINLAGSIHDLTRTHAHFIPSHERELWRDLNRQFDELQKKITVKMSHMEKKAAAANNNETVSPTDIAGLVGRGFKSNLSSAKSRADKQSRCGKRVTFAEGLEAGEFETIVPGVSPVDDEHLKLSDSPVVLQPPKATSTPQPRMISTPQGRNSSSEILRLKKRILPAQPSHNTHVKGKYELLDNVKISRYNNDHITNKTEKLPPRPPSRLSVFSDASSFFDDLAVHGKDTDYTDRGCSGKAKSYGMSSFYPDSGMTQKLQMTNAYADDSDSESEDDDEIYVRGNDVIDANYRVLKAVDLGALSGFQHRKFKKPSAAPETNTTHFVKIKLK